MVPTAPNTPAAAPAWCPARIRLSPPPEPTAPCMLHAGHPGPHSASAAVVEDYAAKPRKVAK